MKFMVTWRLHDDTRIATLGQWIPVLDDEESAAVAKQILDDLTA